MEKVEQRLKCLEIAAIRTVDAHDTMKRAEAYYEFINKNHAYDIPVDAKRLDPKKADTSRIQL
ncbi:MAG: hypothetical protein ABI351_02395 [Herbaspirillum sp.]